jgi:hypothetical protein
MDSLKGQGRDIKLPMYGRFSKFWILFFLALENNRMNHFLGRGNLGVKKVEVTAKSPSKIVNYVVFPLKK